MAKSMRLRYGEFELFVQDFNDLVADKLYSKMDYHMWRKIACYRNEDTVVFIEWDNEGADITFGEEAEWHHFVFGDDSFGDFLLDNVLKDNDGYWDDPWSPWLEDADEGRKRKEEEQEVEWIDSYGNIHKGTAAIQCTSSNVYSKRSFKVDFASSESAKNVALDCSEAIKAADSATKDRLTELLSSGVGVMTIADDTSPSMSCVIDTKVDKAEFESKLEALSEKIQAVADKYNNNNKKEISTMKGFNFDFGPMNGNVVRMSIYGLAVKNKTGSWVAYDAKNGEIMDVDVFNFDGSKFMYRMPVAINDVAVGDVIVHMSVPMFVVGKSEDGKAIYAVDPVAGERKEIMLTKSPFGFNFVTKVVNFLGNTFNADASNPFGNLGLMMMLSGDGDFDAKDLMFMSMMTGNGFNGNNIMSNPMMAYALLGDKSKDIEPMLWFAMMGNMNSAAPANNGCNCGQHNQ